jgi:hypothetical protein
VDCGAGTYSTATGACADSDLLDHPGADSDLLEHCPGLGPGCIAGTRAALGQSPARYDFDLNGTLPRLYIRIVLDHDDAALHPTRVSKSFKYIAMVPIYSYYEYPKNNECT